MTGLFEIVFAAVLSGSVEALTGKAVEGAAGKLAERFKSGVEGRSLEAVAQAVRRAVEAARNDLVNDYWAGEDEHSRDVVALLRHPPFVEEVTRRVLFQGQPDFDRLRRHYLTEEGDEAASERWEALEAPLAAFFDSIERHLAADPELGAVVRHSQQLARLDKLAESTQILATASREVQRLETSIAASTETTADRVGLLVRTAGRQEVHLGELVGLLRQVVEKLGGPRADTAASSQLTASEIEYLRLLRAECDRLPLAEDQRGSKKDQTRGRASLANVYVDLATTLKPSLVSVLDLLDVPEEKRSRLREELERFAGKGLAQAGGLEMEEAGEWMAPRSMKAQHGRRPEEHPLKRLLPDGMTLEDLQRPLTALEALARHRHLVLLGDPGSGKSTFVNHLAATFAAGLLGEQPEWAEILEGRFDQPLMPLRVVLRRWSAGLDPDTEVTVDRVHETLAEQAEGLDPERLQARLHDRRTLVLFDGLDEVPAGEGGGEKALDRRRWVLDAVGKFLTAHAECRVLVTSRVKPYRETDYQLTDLPVVELAPLDFPRIESFCDLWYREAERIRSLPQGVSAHERRERLLDALRTRPVLAEMAETPLLLTMLARVNSRAVLPEGRAELYHECIDQLLWEWEKEKAEEGAAPSLVALVEETKPPLNRADIERVLRELTFEAHRQSGKDIVTLTADSLRKALAVVHPSRGESAGWGWAAKVVGLMEDRSGLLVADGAGGFTFPHRSFQEYLAARWLLDRGNVPVEARELVEDDAWREVVLLACGYLGSQGSYTDVQAILAELVAGAPPYDASGWRRVGLAGQAWWEFGPHRARGEVGKELGKKIPTLLTRLMQHRDLPAAQRLEAGLLLADLDVLPEDLDDWVEIPADKLPYPFKMAKYPVTNAQYRKFVEAGGYDPDKPWWSEKVKKELTRLWGESWRKGPRYWGDRRFDRSTQPVVGVSWYEAAAYCAWRTETLRESGDEAEVRLPTKEEWVRAAGGVEGSKYPWGDSFEPWRVNSIEAGLDQPTPVSMYPGGASAEGVYDLAGNVWEWTADSRGLGRVLKGGAFWSGAEHVGASARLEVHPRRGNLYYGFRCVFVPVSRALS